MQNWMDVLAGMAALKTRYYEIVEDGYIVSVGTGEGGTEITAEEYDEIMAMIADKPTAPEGYDYRLKADLTWEQYELPPAPDPETLPVDDPMEALALLLGGDDDE